MCTVAHCRHVEREHDVRQFEAEDRDDEGDWASRRKQCAVRNVAPAPRAQQPVGVDGALQASKEVLQRWVGLKKAVCPLVLVGCCV